MKLYFFVVECINIVYYVTENTLNVYKINRLFLVISCYSMWQLMSNWLTWKFGLKKAIRLSFINCTLRQGCNFVVKRAGNSLVYNQHSYRADAEVKYYKYRFPILFCRGVLKATLITVCFIPTNDLEINKPNFVVGHGIVVQLGCTTIRLWYKQEQQYGKTHQLGFIRAVSWSAQNGESHWSHVHITLK